MRLKKNIEIKVFDDQGVIPFGTTEDLRNAAESISNTAFELAGELTAHKVGRLVEMAVELERLDVMLRQRRSRLLN